MQTAGYGDLMIPSQYPILLACDLLRRLHEADLEKGKQMVSHSYIRASNKPMHNTEQSMNFVCME